MATNIFLSKDNIKLLWDVISDEDIFKYLKTNSQERISQMFINNLRGFYETERKKTNNVVDINKKYILLILNHIKKTYTPIVPNKIKISYEEPPLKELVTYEEIQNDRKSQFDRDLNRAQEEFTNAVALKVPDVPNFSDNYKEAPITEMDKILKEMTAKRNYEVEQISRRFNDSGEDNFLLKSYGPDEPATNQCGVTKFEIRIGDPSLPGLVYPSLSASTGSAVSRATSCL